MTNFKVVTIEPKGRIGNKITITIEELEKLINEKYSEGYNAGYSAGYSAGYNATLNFNRSVVDWNVIPNGTNCDVSTNVINENSNQNFSNLIRVTNESTNTLKEEVNTL